MKRNTQRINLNGEWDFAICNEEFTGADSARVYDKKILVPYCPESRLSGLSYSGEIKYCSYRKIFEAENINGRRLFLCVGACDYRAKVFVNGNFVGEHTGGYTPFQMDITAFLSGRNVLEILVCDDMKECKPSGKQTKTDRSFGCFYTRITGIWQDVYLESVPNERLTDMKFYPDPSTGTVKIFLEANAVGEVEIRIFYKGKLCLACCEKLVYRGDYVCKLSETHLWELGHGRLYDVTVKFKEDEISDKFGLRSVAFKNGKFLLNGKSVFQRLVLDQGYYEDGLYTPKDDEQFEEDIKRAIELGFNGARLHQKVFSPKYLEIADEYGFMVWGEYPSWGLQFKDTSLLGNFITEWQQAVSRDFNHPCVVCWCPLNEIWCDLDNSEILPDIAFIECVYRVTKILDPTRPCVDVSGGYHGRYTDVFDFHCYESLATIRECLYQLQTSNQLHVLLLYPYRGEYVAYAPGQPVMLSEFGGRSFAGEGRSEQVITENTWQSDAAWSYGSSNGGEEEFVEYYEQSVKAIIGCSKVCGFCYTQLYDIEQEKNGLFYFNRLPKLSKRGERRFLRANSCVAEIESEEQAKQPMQ